MERGEAIPSDMRTIVVCGMGGSHLAADLFARGAPEKSFIIHHDYGIPLRAKGQERDTLYLVSSYSGETEETLSAFRAVRDENLPLVVMTSGGSLLEAARRENVPTIVIPHEDIEPRMTLGYMVRALASLFPGEDYAPVAASIPTEVDNDSAQREGEALALGLQGNIPVLYASEYNAAIAYILKATFNETAKIPAFWDTVPEACHNELSGYDFGESFTPRAQTLSPLFITDTKDNPRVGIRMRLMQEMISARNVSIHTLPLSPNLSSLAGALQIILVGTWAAVFLADFYDVPNAKTPLIARFKQKIAEIP